MIVLSRSSCFFAPANYTRTADENVTSPASAQHSTRQSALHKELLALLNRWLHQSWASSFCLLPILLYSSLCERSGRRQPPSERRACIYLFLSSPFSSSTCYTVSERLDKPWSLVSSVPPPRYVHLCLSRIGFSIPTSELCMLVDFHRILLTDALALSACHFFAQEKVPTSTSTGEDSNPHQ